MKEKQYGNKRHPTYYRQPRGWLLLSTSIPFLLSLCSSLNFDPKNAGAVIQEAFGTSDHTIIYQISILYLATYAKECRRLT